MAIDHDAPKDLGWAQDAILDLDTRLTALEAIAALQSPVTPQAADDDAQGQT